MKKRLLIIVIFLLSLTVSIDKVRADEGPIMSYICEAPENLNGEDAHDIYLVNLTTLDGDLKWYFFDNTIINNALNYPQFAEILAWFKSDDDKNWGDATERVETNIKNTKCPEKYEIKHDLEGGMVTFYGETEPKEIYRLEENEYVFLKIMSKGDMKHSTAEITYTWTDYEKPIVYGIYYNEKGKLEILEYGNIKNNVLVDSYSILRNIIIPSDMFSYQRNILISNNDAKFFNLNENNSYVKSLPEFTTSKTRAYDQEIQYYYEYSFGNRINHDNLKIAIGNWYDKNLSKITGGAFSTDVESENDELIRICKEINENPADYEFKSDYTKNDIISDLTTVKSSFLTTEEVENGLKLCSDPNEPATQTNSATNCALEELLGDYKNSLLYVEETLGGDLYKYVRTDVEQILTTEYDTSDKSYETLETLTACVVNLDKYKSDYGIKESEIGSLRDSFEEYAEKFNIIVILDCEGLLGDDLIEKINSYLNIIKIAVPIIIIAFGIIDFSKAIVLGDDEMKKAKNNFIKRLGIAVLVFLTPTIINIILTIANKVWTFINPDTCVPF